MAQTKYKWNRDELNACLTQMRQSKETLDENKTFFEGIQTIVETNWLSVAGVIYQKNLAVDMRLYLALLSDLEETISDLDQCTNQIYVECEENVQKAINEALSQIKG